LIRSYQALGTVEWHSPKWDVYLNGGGEYAGKSWFLSAPGKAVGYGSPFFANTGCSTEAVPGTPANGFTPGGLASCTGDTRVILEGTFGVWYKPYNGPKGRLQFGPHLHFVSLLSALVCEALALVSSHPLTTRARFFLTHFQKS
jgi:hypothetical protein